MFRRSGVPVFRAVPVFRCSGVPVFRCSGVPVFLVLVHAKDYALLGNDNERSYLFLVLYINKRLRVLNQVEMSAGTRRRLEDALNAGKEIENNR